MLDSPKVAKLEEAKLLKVKAPIRVRWFTQVSEQKFKYLALELRVGVF